MVHACNPSTQDAKAGTLKLEVNLGYSRFQASLDYVVIKPSLKTEKKCVCVLFPHL
jgi:hypothetical protein